MPPLLSGESAVVRVIAVPLIYFAMVFLGRRLKRRDGVRLGWLYQLFAISLALYAALAFTEFHHRRELGSTVGREHLPENPRGQTDGIRVTFLDKLKAFFELGAPAPF